jgi:hypothetical protein
MNWTESIPDKDGWYWRIEACCIDGVCHHITEPVACHVVFDEDGKLGIAKGTYFISPDHARLKPENRYLWFGPIQVPQAPTGWEEGEPADWKSGHTDNFDSDLDQEIAKIRAEAMQRDRLLAEQYGKEIVSGTTG